MARIYIARSTGIGSFERHVVLKVILPERANDESSVQMFLDEARLAASLNHQNVAQVFEVGEDVGIHFLAMEYVHGQDLRALLAKAGAEGTRVPLELALTVVAGAAAGLHHAHERRTSDGTPMGIVHRDVSPSNIMIGYDGAVKLLDFGIAKATMRTVETQSGIIKGKFAYMSPEQCRGRDVDRRSDVFSLGIILYEVTTQHRCFRADSDFDTMHRIVTGDVVRPTRLVQGYPQALEAIIMKALALDATQRYQSAGLLLEAIESFALAARMSLSTMALGRFMRDMFGDIQEPWLEPGRLDVPARREQTISNTNASGARPPPRPSPVPQAYTQPSQHPSQHEEAPLHLAPGTFDLPVDHGGGPGAAHDLSPGHDLHGEVGSARPYSPLPELYGAAATPAPDLVRDERASSPNLPPMLPQIPGSVARAMGIAGGSQSIPPLQFAAHSGSESGPAHGALQGYTGAPGLGPGHSESSHPYYDPAQDPDLDVDLHPTNRLLYLGIGVVLIGIIVVIAISLSDHNELPALPRTSPTGSTTTAGPGESVNPEGPSEPARPGVAAPGSPSGPAPGKLQASQVNPPAAATDAGAATVSDDSISLHVVSHPAGADVYLAGDAIGVTPLDVRMKRTTGYQTLTLHRARFQNATTTVDLSGDCSRELTLTPIADEQAVRPPNQGRDRPSAGRDRTERTGSDRSSANPGRPRPSPPAPPTPPPTPPPPAKTCQDPGQLNPFDKSCDGQPCPPCAGK
jgi:serine/threonine protein kinase